MKINLYNVDTHNIMASYESVVIPRQGEFIRFLSTSYKVVDVEHSIVAVTGDAQDKVTLLVKKV